MDYRRAIALNRAWPTSCACRGVRPRGWRKRLGPERSTRGPVLVAFRVGDGPGVVVSRDTILSCHGSFGT